MADRVKKHKRTDKKTVRKGAVLLLAAVLLLTSLSACGKKDKDGNTDPAQGTGNPTVSDIDGNGGNEGSGSQGDPAGSSGGSGNDSQAEASRSAESILADLPEGTTALTATYLGVLDYGAPETTKENAGNFRYRFRVDGIERTYTIDNSMLDSYGDPAYPIQNKLKENYPFTIFVNGDKILDAEEILEKPSSTADPGSAASAYTPPVSGNPGERTVLNFLKTALMPVGTTLYVFGGGWDWQDTGSSIQARTLGVSSDWVRFFNEHDENYTYRDKDGDADQRDPATSYYPFGKYNEYYYAGLDCSGFVGWTIYNTFETENGKSGYVGYATNMAKRFSQDYGWGSFSHQVAPSESNTYKLRPGDIISMKGHVWISLGTCSDGSVLIVHSTTGNSRTGQPGCGVCLTAIGNDKNCEAYLLADSYMQKYYPEWYRRYSVPLRSPDSYFKMDDEDAGRFTWDTTSGQGLSDTEGLQNMTPAEVLKLCYGA